MTEGRQGESRQKEKPGVIEVLQVTQIENYQKPVA